MLNGSAKRFAFGCRVFFRSVLLAAIICGAGGVLRPSFASTIDKAFLPPHKPVSTPAVAVKNSVIPLPGRKPLGPADQDLSRQDAARYRRIFDLQKRGQWDKADQEISELTDLRLRGHVLFQRLMHPKSYSASYEELGNWLDLYGDHPNAWKVYRLALSRQPKEGARPLRKPQETRVIGETLDEVSLQGETYEPQNARSEALGKKTRKLARKVNRAISANAPDRAFGILKAENQSRWLDSVEEDRILSRIALAYLHTGQPAKARVLAEQAARRSGTHVPLAGWVAGLVAWRRGAFLDSASYFEMAAVSPYGSGWIRTAGAYWASRAHMRMGNVRSVSRWLHEAASYPRTFYGILATRALGQPLALNWDVPAFSDADRKSLAAIPAGSRAIALVQADQKDLAEDELRRIHPGNDERLKNALIAYANTAGLPSFAMRLGSAFSTPDGKLYDAALYPLSPWTPKSGYRVDKALVHAVIRQESRFDPLAESASGAEGLMQVMPGTAREITGSGRFGNGRGSHILKDPGMSLEIGQTYLDNLMQTDSVGGDLFSLMVAYNAGPGNLRRWKASVLEPINDPLLFMESIPLSETRAYVERVMSNYWIYRQRLGEPTPTLDAVVSGRWPTIPGLQKEEKRADRASGTVLARLDGK